MFDLFVCVVTDSAQQNSSLRSDISRGQPTQISCSNGWTKSSHTARDLLPWRRISVRPITR